MNRLVIALLIAPDFLTYPHSDPKTHTPQSRGEVCVDSCGQNPAEAIAEALAEVCKFTPTVKRAKDEFEKVVSELVAAGCTAEKVREFGQRFWEVCHHARRHNRETPTPAEVAKWIDRMTEEKPATPKTPPQREEPQTPEDFEKTRRMIKAAKDSIGNDVEARSGPYGRRHM